MNTANFAWEGKNSLTFSPDSSIKNHIFDRDKKSDENKKQGDNFQKTQGRKKSKKVMEFGESFFLPKKLRKSFLKNMRPTHFGEKQNLIFTKFFKIIIIFLFFYFFLF